MSNKKALTGKSTPFKWVYAVVALFLLVAFAGKVTISSIYGHSGIQKAVSGQAVEDQEQENNDKKESKFADEKLTGFISSGYLEIAPVLRVAQIIPHALHSSVFITMYCLAVLTPPPNC